VIFHLKGKALISGIHGRPFQDGPRLEATRKFQAEVPMEVSGVVFVDDEKRYVERGFQEAAARMLEISSFNGRSICRR
jgi:hypothetical protein